MSMWKCYLAAATLVMAACAPEPAPVDRQAETAATSPPPASPATVLEVRTEAPEDETAAVRSWLEQKYTDLGEVRFFHASADLNGDGRREIVVHAIGPMICGTGGCNTLVLAPTDDGYRLVSEISVSRPPIQVLPRTSNGWHNLLVRVSGGGIPEGYDAELRFDGTTYPSNPTVAPAEPAADTEGARILIPEYSDFAQGTPVPE